MRNTIIIAALAATLSGCAVDDEALDDQTLDAGALDDEALAVESSTDEPGTTPAASRPACNASVPGPGWVLDSSYGAPSACRKCQEAGLRLEASGRWRTHCTLLGGIGPALLFRFCVACLNTEDGDGGNEGLEEQAAAPR
jgi:hypothetical protein